MSRAIVEVTLRALLGRRRTLLMGLLAAVPLLIAALVRAGGSTSDGAALTAGLLNGLVVTTVLPLVALVFGTSALGTELDDGTAVYLLVKPIERWRIVASKYVVAAGVTVALMFPATLLAGLASGAGRGGELVAIGFALAVIVGALAYVAVFIALSVVTSRALLVGLAYVLIWEGVLAGLFAGTSLLSVRQYTLALARWLAGAQGSSVTSSVDASTAGIMALVVCVLAIAIATRRLMRWQVRTAD
ncbi:MAG TPA: ABC transporter permease [Candidatus Limnocylindrales bacterium]